MVSIIILYYNIMGPPSFMQSVVMQRIPALRFLTLHWRLSPLDKAELQPRGIAATSPTPVYCVCRHTCSQALAFTRTLHDDSYLMYIDICLNRKEGGESLRLPGQCVMTLKKDAANPSENNGRNYWHMEYQSRLLGIITALRTQCPHLRHFQY